MRHQYYDLTPPQDYTFEPPLTSGYADLLRTGWHHKWRIALGGILGICLGVLYCQHKAPTYQSMAQVLIVEKRPRSLPIPAADPRLSYFKDYLSAHDALFKSTVIVERAIEEGDLASLESLKDAPDVASAIKANLSVTQPSEDRMAGDGLLYVSYRSGVPEDAQRVLEAVIDTYTDFVNESYEDDRMGVRTLFQRWQEEVGKELEQRQLSYRALRESTPPDLWKGESGVNVPQERATRISSELITHRVRLAELEEQLTRLNDALEQGVNRQILVEMVGKWTLESQGSPTLDEQLFTLLMEEQSLLKKFGPENPQVAGVRERIRLTRERMYGDAETGSELGLMDPVDAYIELAKQEAAVSKGVIESLSGQLNEAQTDAKEMDRITEDLDQLRFEVDSTEGLQKEILAKLQELDVVKESKPFHAQIISPPYVGLKVSPRRAIVLAIAAICGLLLGGGLAYGAEWGDQSFRTSNEIRNLLGWPIVEHLPSFRPVKKRHRVLGTNGAILDPHLSAHHRPMSSETEAYRAVRTFLYYSGRCRGKRVVLVTSPSAGEGKSTLAANLAALIAKSGKRVVLVDADLRKPRLHEMFGMSNEGGLVSVLASEMQCADAVQPSGIPNLDVLPCGPIPGDPAEVLGASQLRDIFDLLRKRYDYVVVDTSPLLEVTDPCAAASCVDGVLLTLRNTKDARRRAERAKEILTFVGTDVLGAVISAVGHRSDYRLYQSNYYHSNDASQLREVTHSAGNGRGTLQPVTADSESTTECRTE